MNRNFPPDVGAMLDALVAGGHAALGGNLVGLYLRGSLVMGEFDPPSSDIDFFAVTEQPVTDVEYDRLAALHVRLSALPNRYAGQLEGPYIPRDSARRFRAGEQHPTVYRGEALQRHMHGENWVLERWVVREHGVALRGPDPRTLIDPMAPAEIREAVRTRLGDWVEFAQNRDDPAWWQPLGHCAYVAETMCRVGYTLATGQLCSKRHAVSWALEHIAEPWRSTVARSQTWRHAPLAHAAPSGAVVDEVRQFVFWTAAQGAIRGAVDER
ncbi:MAG TPA: aminoglycoside adenylyltransferase domain-containing protein [Nonomuraea sp.]|nr:aminoglycoside adenylyltransferase domain-containing protein [Nonomuraea sp.]